MRSESRLSSLLVGETSVVRLILVAGPLVAACAWMLVIPGRVVSREMTWDLLFNLAGAWHLYNGHAAHVDFHDPVGQLDFLLTGLGFWFVGPSVFAFVVGEIIVVVFVFAVAVAASARRLPLLPATLFVLLACGLILMPINVGETVDAFTFAMSYNAYCWAALSILSLILLVPPRVENDGTWVDVAIGATLIVVMYYLKVTYYLAAVVELLVAVLVCSHVRGHWIKWGAVAVLVMANAVAPYNWPYLADILGAVRNGAIRENPRELLVTLFANVPELSLYAAATVVAVALWRIGEAPLRLPVSVALPVVLAAAMLSQNAQIRGLPSCMVVVFLFYAHFCRAPAIGQRHATTWALMALMVFPAASIARQTASLAVYCMSAAGDASLFAVDRTNLRGLAVPVEQEDLIEAVAARRNGYARIGHDRAIEAGEVLSQYEYVQSLLEATALFDGVAGASGIVLLDQVNPLPFALGTPPPRNGNLWLDFEFPWPSPDAMFAEADHVLIPRFSTYGILTKEAVRRYGGYLSKHFPQRTESRSWTLLSRAGSAPGLSGRR